MKLFKLLAVVFAFTLTGQAHALEVGLLGGLNFWGYGFTPPTGATLTGKTSGQLGLGAFVKTGLNPILDLELDLIYMKKKNTITIAAGTASQTNVFETASYMIPVMVRTSFIPGGFVNVGAGAYYEIGTSNGVTFDGASVTYSDAGVKHHDLGLIGSVQLRMPILPLVHFLVDGRYLYGLNEQNNDVATSGNFKNRSYQAFAGISVGI
jgi:hypothetical protein